MGFERRVGLGGRDWEPVDRMVLWITEVDTVTEDFWGATEDDAMIFSGDAGAGEELDG